MSNSSAMNWWQREDLCFAQGQLHFAGHAVTNLYQRLGSPSFVYSASRVKANLQRVHDALNTAGFHRHTVYYAMKANRFAPLLTLFKTSNLCGIDACSPYEVELAVSCGFTPQQISFTAGSLSEQDFSILNRYDGLVVNCDSLHAIKRWGELRPDSNIGIRINPSLGIGRGDNSKLLYAGERTTKFGIYREQFEEAIALARQYNLKLNRIHFHTGCGYLTEQLPMLDQIAESARWFIDTAGTIEYVNIGGGLGVPHVAEDVELNLDAWGKTLAKHFDNQQIHLEVEPGDYVVKDAGLLLLGKTYLETKQQTLFLGTDAGFNIAPEPAHYGLPFQPVPLHWNGEELQAHHVVGNINEALDVWAENALLPNMTNHDAVVLINAGAYAASMASNHCMRGQFREHLLFE